jgi:hypothetical protein
VDDEANGDGAARMDCPPTHCHNSIRRGVVEA